MESRKDKINIASFLIEDKYRIYRHLLLQLSFLMITVGVFFDAPDKLNLSLNRFWGWVGYFLFMNMVAYFNAFVLFPRFMAKGKIILYIVSTIIFTLFALFVMMVIQDNFYDIGVIHQEPSTIAIFLDISSSLLSLFLFIGGISAILSFKNWITGNRRINELKIATSQSELKFLKSQINPHFLFNMLNNANILVEDEPDMASYILTKLDDLLKYQLDDSTKDKVYLKDDIDFLTNYLELEKIRRDDFEYYIDIKGEIENILVAPLLFIPFVENAVKHNSTIKTESYINMLFELDKNKLFFTCRNSISTKTPTQKKKDGGLGLSNIKRRLDLLFDNNYTLKQIKTDTEYTVYLELKL